MKGLAPRRRTFEYLNSSRLQLRNQINVLVLAFHAHSTRSAGAKFVFTILCMVCLKLNVIFVLAVLREFKFWHWGQLIHQNPHVQCISFSDRLRTPNPYIQCYLRWFNDMSKYRDNRYYKVMFSTLRGWTGGAAGR